MHNAKQLSLGRRVQSIGLFRILDVTSLHPWWQRRFSIGTVTVLTSDSNNPHWRLRAPLSAMTDAMYGIGGSFAQLALFSVVVWVWLPLMVVAPIGHFLLPVSAKPVYLVNR